MKKGYDEKDNVSLSLMPAISELVAEMMCEDWKRTALAEQMQTAPKC
jgi:hypothetical protein